MNSVFDQSTGEAPTTTVSSDNYTEQLVGEGKKYTTGEDLAKGYANAEAHIAKLVADNESLRQDVSSRSSVEDAIAKITQGQNQPETITPTPTSVPTDENSLNKLVQEAIAAADVSKSKESNVSLANNKLIESYGGDAAKATEAVNAKARELGVSTDYLKGVAEVSHEAFLKLVGASTEQPQSPTPQAPSNSVNTSAESFTSSRVEHGSKEYFDAIRKNNPKSYHSSEIQNQIFEAAASGKYFK